MAIGRSKVVIIGAGNVGTALAHHLVICNTCNNLVLINRNAEKSVGRSHRLESLCGILR